MVKSLPVNTRDAGLILGLGRSPGAGNGNPLWYSYLENSMDRGAWLAIVHRVAQSWTQQKQVSMHAVIVDVVAVVLATKSCLTLLEPHDCSPPGSSVHGILQVRIPEWVAISFSREPSGPRDRTCICCIDRQVLYC